MYINPVLATDFYKTGHIYQYPPETEMVYSNFTCRSDRLAKLSPYYDHKVVFFGLQGVIKWLLQDLWNKEFFNQSKDFVLSQYKEMMDNSLGKDAVKVQHISDLHDLGYLPIKIKALREGSRANLRVPLYTIRNTLDSFYWLTNYLETQLSAETWKAITTATIAYEYRRMFEMYAKETGSPLDFVKWQGHDFSCRGMSGIYDGAQSSVGHLLSFYGTDTISSIDYLKNYYKATGLIGGSVPATEHSVMSCGGEDSEIETFKRIITKTYPTGIVSIVSDTWDFWNVITNTAKTLKNEIMSRKSDALGFAKTVFRPDSGDPVKVIVGDQNAPKGSPENKGAAQCLWEVFGGTINKDGYRTLDSHVGLIYGDSITLERAHAILEGLKNKGFASCNIVFGIGSYTYQYLTRDTFGCAIKSTYAVVNGQGRALSKKPKTDSGTKNSAVGLLRVEKENQDFVLHENQTWEQEGRGLLETVFENGNLMRLQTLDDIRKELYPQ